MKRKKVSMKVSKKMFTRTADRTHKKNFAPSPMRGGFSL